MENFDNLKKTPLFEKHCALGGKIVDFGGWALPVQYTSILDECKAVRERAGLFDVSHMGEVDIIGNDAYAYMQKMVTNDVTSMTPGRCRYAVMCYDNGGAVDDVLIYKFADDHYMLIVNAGNTDKDFAWLSEHAFGDVRSSTTAQNGVSSLCRVRFIRQFLMRRVLKARSLRNITLSTIK